MDSPHASPPPPPMTYAAPSFGQEPTRRHRGRWLWMGLLLLILAGLVVGCGMLVRSVNNGKEEARSLLKDLHIQMIRKDWDGIYAEAGPDYRNGVSREKSEAYFSAIERKLGPPLSSEVDGLTVNENTSGQYLRAAFKTTFTQDATGEETIVWKKVDGQYRMQSYTVNSAELVER